MNHINKPRALRQYLGLDIRQAGEQILGLTGKQAYDTWAALERSNDARDALSSPMRQLLTWAPLILSQTPMKSPGGQ